MGALPDWLKQVPILKSWENSCDPSCYAVAGDWAEEQGDLDLASKIRFFGELFVAIKCGIIEAERGRDTWDQQTAQVSRNQAGRKTDLVGNIVLRFECASFTCMLRLNRRFGEVDAIYKLLIFTRRAIKEGKRYLARHLLCDLPQHQGSPPRKVAVPVTSNY